MPNAPIPIPTLPVLTIPGVTMTYAGLFTLLLVALSSTVVAARLRFGVLHGDGGNETLAKLARTQANFAEYIPLLLLLAALVEATGASRTLIGVLLGTTLVARLLHPFGMFAAPNSPAQYICRGGSIVVTFAVLAILAVLLLER